MARKQQIEMKAGRFNKLTAMLVFCLLGLKLTAQPSAMVYIDGGTYVPFLKGQTEQVNLNSFWMDEKAVTNADYLKFIETNPQWSKTNIKRIFADENYLSHWTEGKGSSYQFADKAPVVNVSWFAAQAYCQWQKKRLPNLHEWEYAAKALPESSLSDDSLQQIISDWYSSRLRNAFEVGSLYRNVYGVWDMHGLVWEWVYDFNSIVMNDDGRNQEEMPEGLFCGSASLIANDASDYASFVRFAFRTSLKGNYSLRKLGFRCVKNAD
jgi:formylglycine-generating enzyme